MSKITPKIKALLWRFVKWTALNVLRASIVILGYLLYSTIIIAEYALLALAWGGKYLGVHIRVLESEAPDMTQRFDEDEIEAMAKALKGKETINEIEDKFDISYRQARKIKESLNNPLSINHYSWEDKLV